MNDKITKVLLIVLAILVVFVLLSVVFIANGYNRKLANLEATLTSSRDTTVELGERIRQQESIINAVTNRQSELENVTGELTTELRQTRELVDRTTDTLDKLINVEQDIDGYTGAVRGTVDKVLRSIDVTLQGIESEGITE